MKIKYDPILGYSDISNVNFNKLVARLKIIADFNGFESAKRILLVGCGNGDEAFALAQFCKSKIYGIDLNAIPYESDDIVIINGSADNLPWVNNYFDLVICNHVMEHVDSPKAVLREIKRVLLPRGYYYIAFPNKRRVVPSYWSSHLKLSLREIVVFNLRDLKYILNGKWENKYGAHAGFSHREWKILMSEFFDDWEFDSFPNLFGMNRLFKKVESIVPFCLFLPSLKIKKIRK